MAIAVAILIPILFTLGLVFHRRAALFQQIAWEKPPAVLADRARELLKRLGYSDPPEARRMGFAYDRRFIQYVEEHDLSPGRWERMAAGRPTPVYFWYRESPDAFEPYDGGGAVTQVDPPLLPGMASLRLDPGGRLIELTVHPAQEDSPPPRQEPDWPALLAEAGLDPATLAPAEPAGVPPVPVEARAAWEGRFPGPPGYPVRVEAATYAGRVVDFRILGPWGVPRAAPRRADLGALTGGVNLLMFPVLLVGLLLARRNWRLGRGDRLGASRLAAFAFACTMTAWALGTPHSASPATEADLLDNGLARGLYLTANLWVFYLALEPYVRRRWPRTLLSWSRVLAGRFRDPLVGRDVLAGTLMAGAIFGCLILGRVVVEWSGRPAPRLLELSLVTLLGPGRIASRALNLLSLAILLALMMLLLLVLLRAALRSQRAAVVAFFVVWTAIPLITFGHRDTWLAELPVWAGFGALLTVLVVRFGLLATVIEMFIGSFSSPVTLAFEEWYAQPTMVACGLILGLVGFGLYACLAGRGLSWGPLMEDEQGAA